MPHLLSPPLLIVCVCVSIKDCTAGTHGWRGHEIRYWILNFGIPYRTYTVESQSAGSVCMPLHYTTLLHVQFNTLSKREKGRERERENEIDHYETQGLPSSTGPRSLARYLPVSRLHGSRRDVLVGLLANLAKLRFATRFSSLDLGDVPDATTSLTEGHVILALHTSA